jgi:hypothetical protein
MVMGYNCLMVTHNNIRYIMVVSFINGGNPSTLRKSSLLCESWTNFIT